MRLPANTGRWARVGAAGFEFSSPILAGIIIGHFADLHFRTDPWITLAGLLLGVCLGFYRLIALLSAFQRDTDGGHAGRTLN